MPPAIFKNPEHQELFDKQGFIVLPFLDSEDVDFLDKTFDEMHPELPTSGGFISGSYSQDFAYKKKASDTIHDTFMPHFKRLFKDFQAIGGAFLFKLPSPNSELIAHQDWTIVDEDKYYALNVWVPLTDTHAENGPLMVLPGSHYQKFKVLRAPTLPFFFTGNETVVKENLIPLYVKAGHTVILNQSLVHYSPANVSTKIRKAITAGVLSKDAKLRLYFKDNNSDKEELEMFSQDRDFLISFDDFFSDIFQRPKMGKSEGTIPYKVPSFSKEEIEPMLQGMRTEAGFAVAPKPKTKPPTVPTSEAPIAQASFFDKLKRFVGFGKN